MIFLPKPAFLVCFLWIIQMIGLRAQSMIKADSVIDLGVLSAQGGTVDFKILIENKGKPSVLLSEAILGCGCITTQKFPITLPGGQKILLPARYKPSDKPGFFYKQIKIKTLGEAEPLVVEVRGRVVPSGVPLHYRASFGYNQDSFDTLSAPYLAFVREVGGLVNKHIIYVRIESSASFVPTHHYPTNQMLAQARGHKALQLLKQALFSHKIDSNRLHIMPITHLVQGPNYQNDYKKAAYKYEPFQYVYINVF